MRHLRWWILAAAFGTFAAGMSVGLAIPRVEAAMRDGSATTDGDNARDAEYARDFAARYDLNGQQQRSFGMVLLSGRNEQLAILGQTDISQLPDPIRNRLLEARRRTERRVRALLDDEQRARYDRDSRPAGEAVK